MNFANVKALAIPEGNVKQIADGQGVVLWKKAAPPLKISSITKPAVGTSSITGDRTATMARTAMGNDGTFTVYYSNFDTSKYSRIKISYSIVFGQVMGVAYAVSKVTFSSSTEVTQNVYNGETKTGTLYINRSSSSGSFTVKITNGRKLNNQSCDVTVSITIAAAI